MHSKNPPAVLRPLLWALAIFTISTVARTAHAEGVDDLEITEFAASADGSFLDEDGDGSDWIELHNSGAASLDLGGYFLTDDPDDLTQWTLPDVSLNAGAYMVVFASGKNRTNPASELHTNFSLTAGGEYLALVAPDGVTVVCDFAPEYPQQFFGLSYGSSRDGQSTPQDYLTTPADALYFVPTSDIGSDWQDVGFDDATWSAAKTGLGFGFGYEVFIGEGGDIGADMRGVNEGVYIRLPFEVDSASSVQSLTLSLLFEDGYVAYLNGEQVAAENVPQNVDFNTTALSNLEVSQGMEPSETALDFAGKLVNGTNVLAIHLLNRTRTSSDVLIVPELRGEAVSGELQVGYLAEPSPGQPNSGELFTDYVRDTTFDIDRGFFDTPFDVTIGCATPGATIVYTTDGGTPTLSNGTQVPAPDSNTPPSAVVNIPTSTPLRAAAFKTGLRPSNVDTQTYIFLDDVLDQPAQPPGYPLPWITRSGGTIPGDFEMDPEIVGPVYSREELKAALRDLPTISIVTDIANLFDRQTGIQVNPQDAGEASERRVSVEMIDFEDGSPLQADAGMRMNGNASRSTNRGKHNFRLAFRNEYGTGKLNFPLFGEEAPTETFNQIILRGGNGNSWIHPSTSVRQYAMYTRDQWFRDAHTEMGYPEALQREVHVYFNGLYFGLHHLFERIEEEWAAERFGGEDEDWEGFRIVGGNSIEVIAGTPAEEAARMLTSWQATLDAAAAGDLAAVEEFLDLDAFIDYLLLNFHAGNNDWDQNNVRAMRQRNPSGKYSFYCHDAERAGFNALNTANINIDVTTKNTARGPTSINTSLRTHANSSVEYGIRFADRAYKHLFNGGALTPENGAAQWMARAERIRDSMKAESARWGDHAEANPRTLADFDIALDREYDQWFPARTAVTIGQLRATGLYPDTDPPIFSQHGGQVAQGFELSITNEAGDIYYTLDGSDPRLPGGAVNPGAIQIAGGMIDATEIMAGSDWKYEDSGTDLGTAWRETDFNDTAWSSGAAPLGYGGITNTTIETTVNTPRHVTVYFRKEIEITNRNLITEASMEIHADGGAVVYINGVEAVRDNMPAGDILFSTTSTNDGNEGVFDSYSFDPALLVEGTNTIAVEVHNGSTSSSDMVFDLVLEDRRLNDSNAPIPITATTTVRARSLDDGDWSALAEATFLTGVPAAADNLVISELHYHPVDAEGEATEYLELMNISDQPVDLAGVQFTTGITFAFDGLAMIAPGERALLVSDLTAFEALHGAGNNILGTYEGQLANNGERITLADADGTPIQNFRYDDNSPWPEEADGDGFSLVLIAPEAGPDHDLPQSWRASVAQGGTPGGSDSTTFAGDPETELLGYALGISNGSTDGIGVEITGGVPLFSYPQSLSADDVIYSIETSTDLAAWQPADATFQGHTARSGGSVVATWELPAAMTDRSFVRLVVSLRE